MVPLATLPVPGGSFVVWRRWHRRRDLLWKRAPLARSSLDEPACGSMADVMPTTAHRSRIRRARVVARCVITIAWLTAWGCGEPQPDPQPEQPAPQPEPLAPQPEQPVEDSAPPTPTVGDASIRIEVRSLEVTKSEYLSLRIYIERLASSRTSGLLVSAVCKMGEKHMRFNSPPLNVGEDGLPIGTRRSQGMALFESRLCRIPSHFEHCQLELSLKGDDAQRVTIGRYCARGSNIELGECGELPPPVTHEHRYDAFEAFVEAPSPGWYWLHWCADLRLGSAPRETHEVAARCQLEGKRKPFTEVARLPGGRRAANGETVKQSVIFEVPGQPRSCEFVLRRSVDDHPLADIQRFCLADGHRELLPCP
jgi:hypothetical protein